MGFPSGGFPEPQGPYYCVVGSRFIAGRVSIDGMKVINYIDKKRKNGKLDERSYETTKLRNDAWKWMASAL